MSYAHSAFLRSVADMQGGSGQLKAPTLRLIKVLLVVHIYDAKQDTYTALPGMPAHLPLQIHNATRALQSIAEGRVPCMVAGFFCCQLCMMCRSNAAQSSTAQIGAAGCTLPADFTPEQTSTT